MYRHTYVHSGGYISAATPSCINEIQYAYVNEIIATYTLYSAVYTLYCRSYQLITLVYKWWSQTGLNRHVGNK